MPNAVNTDYIWDKSEDFIRKEFLSRISVWEYECLLIKDQENAPYKNITGEQTPLLRLDRTSSCASYEHYFRTVFSRLLRETMEIVQNTSRDKHMPKPPIIFVKKKKDSDPRDVRLVFRSIF